MKYCIKILSLSFLLLFVLSCGNRVEIAGRYEGVLKTTRNTRQVITNKCIVIVNDDTSMNIDIQGDNIYKGKVSISKEELTKIDDNSYIANKDGKQYTVVFHSGYMVLTINNTDYTTSKGELSKIGK
ncbi:hypothetical protein [Brachyspira sp.]|uniref:hypothetical protein n=1 Tax=Brachyspira sp. TaxID=1977261 RepID=UPI002609D5C0|nr:hypothetical protein [Brachyspira sp.]